jgi:hypothetical protein
MRSIGRAATTIASWFSPAPQLLKTRFLEKAGNALLLTTRNRAWMKQKPVQKMECKISEFF